MGVTTRTTWTARFRALMGRHSATMAHPPITMARPHILKGPHPTLTDPRPTSMDRIVVLTDRPALTDLPASTDRTVLTDLPITWARAIPAACLLPGEWVQDSGAPHPEACFPRDPDTGLEWAHPAQGIEWVPRDQEDPQGRTWDRREWAHHPAPAPAHAIWDPLDRGPTGHRRQGTVHLDLDPGGLLDPGVHLTGATCPHPPFPQGQEWGHHPGTAPEADPPKAGGQECRRTTWGALPQASEVHRRAWDLPHPSRRRARETWAPLPRGPLATRVRAPGCLSPLLPPTRRRAPPSPRASPPSRPSPPRRRLCLRPSPRLRSPLPLPRRKRRSNPCSR